MSTCFAYDAGVSQPSSQGKVPSWERGNGRQHGEDLAPFHREVASRRDGYSVAACVLDKIDDHGLRSPSTPPSGRPQDRVSAPHERLKGLRGNHDALSGQSTVEDHLGAYRHRKPTVRCMAVKPVSRSFLSVICQTTLRFPSWARTSALISATSLSLSE